MANKIIGKTDTSGALSVGVSVVSNSSRPILLVGTGVDETKEVIFAVNGTTDVTTHFGADSPFVEAVKILIRNGVNYIHGICVGASGEGNPYETESAAYEAALDKSMLDEDVMCIILDKSDTTIYTDLSAHLIRAESEDLFRYAIVGVPAATTTIEGAKAIATSINHDRIFVAFPNAVDANGATVDGVLTAAGVAAAICTETNDPALPVSGVAINGFGGISKKLLASEQDELAKAGIVALYPESGVPTIYRMVTTAQTSGGSDSIWHDATTRFIADNVLASVIAKLRVNYKRTKNVTRILNSIKTDVITVLEEKEGLEIIQGFDKATVSVVKDPDDIYGALVDYEFKVVTPLYTITITQHMKV
jgi:hypothetical protein